MRERQFAHVLMELVGEPVTTPDGQSLQLARFPWQRPDDASHGISLNDIVGEPYGESPFPSSPLSKTKAL